jgi:hypothetical protein
LAAAALSLSRALVTHDGVDPPEWIVGVALAALLFVAAYRAMRRGVRPA